MPDFDVAEAARAAAVAVFLVGAVALVLLGCTAAVVPGLWWGVAAVAAHVPLAALIAAHEVVNRRR